MTEEGEQRRRSLLMQNVIIPGIKEKITLQTIGDQRGPQSINSFLSLKKLRNCQGPRYAHFYGLQRDDLTAPRLTIQN